MFNFLFKAKDELYYMRFIKYIYRDGWKCSTPKHNSFLLVKKELNKLKKLDKENHPFLFEFREKVNKVNTDNFLSDKYCKEINEIEVEFHQYYAKLYKK